MFYLKAPVSFSNLIHALAFVTIYSFLSPSSVYDAHINFANSKLHRSKVWTYTRLLLI